MATPTYTALATTTLSSSASSVTFSSIPQDYRDLVLVVNGSLTSTLENLYILFNANGTGYSYVLMLGTGSSAVSANYSARTWGELDTGIGNNIYHIMDYSATDKHKTTLFRSNRASGGVLAQAGRWANTAAITSVAISGGLSQGFAAGTTLSLFGIEA
jgi:hypothetical protein